jgi:hypothetical protein
MQTIQIIPITLLQYMIVLRFSATRFDIQYTGCIWHVVVHLLQYLVYIFTFLCL